MLKSTLIFLLLICCIDSNSDTCGSILTPAVVPFAILNGDDEDRVAPWTVSIGADDDGNHRHLCTGIIIKDDVVLTAAHCIEDKRFNKETSKVLAGVLDLRFKGATSMKIEEIYVHPKYVKPKVYYDIAY